MATHQMGLSPLTVQLLISVARTAGQPHLFIAYAPSDWLKAKPTARNRSRWSRIVRRLTLGGFLQRRTDFSRDRVRQVAITAAGWEWILENCGPGAILNFCEELWTDLENINGATQYES